MKKRLLLLMTCVLLILSMSIGAYAAGIPQEGERLDGTIVILHTNDIHGRIVKDDYSSQAGFAAVSAVKKAYEAAGASVLLLDAGDTLHGLPIATIRQGADVVAIMNSMGYDAMVPGNHDFNYGNSKLLELSKSMKFPLLSANTRYNSGNGAYPESVIIEKGGKRFGIFGLSTPETAYKTNPMHIEGLTFANPITYGAIEVKKLQEEKVDFIIALAHIGVDASSEFTSDKIAAQVPGIDLIIDGHSHTAMIGGVPVDKKIKLVPHGSTLIASTGEYMNNIGIVTINTDGTKKADLIPYDKNLPSDNSIQKMITEIEAQQDTILSQVVGKTSVRLEGDREFARKQEVNLGNLAADAIRDATGAEIGFTNGGGIRSSIESGDITKKALITVFPFGNYVVTKKISGEAVLKVLEHGVRFYPELSGGFPQVSGITFEFDASKPSGNRVTNVKVLNKPLDIKATYLFATNDFIAAGGDDYTMMGEFPIANEFGALDEILIEYITKNPNISPKVEGRIRLFEEQVMPPKETEIEDLDETDKGGSPAEEILPVPEETTGNMGKDSTIIYVVKKGDNLWKIAAKQIGNGRNWTAIYELNKDTISNPNRIKIGQKLKIPSINIH